MKKKGEHKKERKKEKVKTWSTYKWYIEEDSTRGQNVWGQNVYQKWYQQGDIKKPWKKRKKWAYSLLSKECTLLDEGAKEEIRLSLADESDEDSSDCAIDIESGDEVIVE